MQKAGEKWYADIVRSYVDNINILRWYIRNNAAIYGWGPCIGLAFPRGPGPRGEGATHHPNIYNVIFL